MEITSYLLGKKSGGNSGTGKSYTGHYDAEGLSHIGWTAEEIKWYQDNGVFWNDDLDDCYKLSASELEGPTNNKIRFAPKISNIGSYAYYDKLIGMPVTSAFEGKTSFNSLFNGCYSLITIPQYDTTNVTSMYSAFSSCYSLRTIPLLNTENVTTTQAMFSSCYSLEKIPLLNTKKVTNMLNMFSGCYNLRSIPQFDTSSVENFKQMFMTCYNLVYVPVLDTSSATEMQNMFASCLSLSDIAVNNILKMCINATSYTGTKKLQYIGLASAYFPESRLQTLSNYQDFLNAGWTLT